MHENAKKNGKLDYLIRPGRRDRKKIVMNGKDNKFIKPKFEKKIASISHNWLNMGTAI